VGGKEQYATALPSALPNEIEPFEVAGDAEDGQRLLGWIFGGRG
jgi:hypothetical protein